MMHEITRLTERLVYGNEFVKLYDDDVRFPNGTTGRYVRLEAAIEGTAVVLIPIHAGQIGLVHTFRYPIGRLVWELPRGFSQGRSIEHTARNELREELGVDAAEVEVIGFLTPDSGLQSARVAAVMARVIEVGGGPEDKVEVESIDWVSMERLEQMIQAGEIEDGFTLAACTLLRLRLRRDDDDLNNWQSLP